MSGKPELLFLAHRIPYPPDKGDKIRSWNILKGLAERYRVHLGCFVDAQEDLQHVDYLRGVCDHCHFAQLSPLTARMKSLSALATGAPLTLAYYRNPALRRWVEDVVRNRDLQAVFLFSSAVAQFLPPSLGSDVRRIIDFVDVDSDKWRQYAASKPWPASWIYEREGRKLLAFERSVAAACDVSLFVSPAEAAFFRRLAPESSTKISHINNGVDFDFFSPDQDFDSPFGTAERALVFTGAMDYWPNADAVIWFADNVLSQLQGRVPEIRFYVVGANPDPAVRRLAQRRGITVTGRVPDVRPYLAHAAAVVAPLRISRGIQNKVLEGMAMARTVVATSQALEGIDAEIDNEVVKADDAAEFVEKLTTILDSGNQSLIGQRARDRVIRHYAWSENVARLVAMLEGMSPSADRRQEGERKVKAAGS